MSEGVDSITVLERPLRHEVIAQLFDQRKQNAKVIADALGNPRKLFYAAGGYDLQHLFMPGSEVMAIIEIVPFLQESDSSVNSFSAAIDKALDDNKNRYISMQDLFLSNSLSQRQHGEFISSYNMSLEAVIDGLRDNIGYKVLPVDNKDQIEGDNFTNALATLAVMGVDMKSIMLGKFRDDYQMEFLLDGVKKTVIYRNSPLSSHSDIVFSQGSNYAKWDRENYEWITGYFQKLPGKTALIASGDYAHVSQHVFKSLSPDVYFGDPSSLGYIPQLEGYSNGYLRNFLLPDVKWFPNINLGYGTANDIVMGKKIA